MTSPLTLTSDISAHQGSESHLTYDDLKAQFPMVLDVKVGWSNSAHPVDISVVEMLRTDSTTLADPSTLPKIIGRIYFLKHGSQIDTFAIKSYLRKTRNGSADMPVPLDQLGQLVTDAIESLAPAKNKERNKSPHLTFIDLQAQFPHLFEADSLGRLKINTRKTAVDAWFETKRTELVDPEAVRKIIGRAFYLKHRKSVNPRHINAHLNGSGEKPVPLNELGQIVSNAVAVLIQGPTERPERQPDDVAPERPVYMVPSIFKTNGRLKKYKNPRLFINKQSPEYIIELARGLITPLKGTAPDSAKGTEKTICAKVFSTMKGNHAVDDDFLQACITAAWDQLTIKGAGYEAGGGAGAHMRTVRLREKSSRAGRR